VCGDGVVTPPGETCEPPGSILPGGQLCRADCTFCGDAVVQAVDGETCDDGNTVSGCSADKPQRPLDACLNSCQYPICDDPSKIKLSDEATTGKKDLVQVHGRLITASEYQFESEDFRIRITRRVCANDPSVVCASDAVCDAMLPGSICTQSDPASLVFETSLPAGTIPHLRPLSWKYKNKLAKTDGGIYALKVVSKMRTPLCAGGSLDGGKCMLGDDRCPDGGACVGYYKFAFKAYGDAERAVSDMETQVFVGSRAWAVRGIWVRLSTSWKLFKKSTFLDPWP
jgi:hypothetical protein